MRACSRSLLCVHVLDHVSFSPSVCFLVPSSAAGTRGTAKRIVTRDRKPQGLHEVRKIKHFSNLHHEPAAGPPGRPAPSLFLSPSRRSRPGAQASARRLLPSRRPFAKGPFHSWCGACEPAGAGGYGHAKRHASQRSFSVHRHSARGVIHCPQPTQGRERVAAARLRE